MIAERLLFQVVRPGDTSRTWCRGRERDGRLRQLQVAVGSGDPSEPSRVFHPAQRGGPPVVQRRRLVAGALRPSDPRAGASLPADAAQPAAHRCLAGGLRDLAPTGARGPRLLPVAHAAGAP